jgi:hypothetical protein
MSNTTNKKEKSKPKPKPYRAVRFQVWGMVLTNAPDGKTAVAEARKQLANVKFKLGGGITDVLALIALDD